MAHADLVPELAPFRQALEQAWVSKGHALTDDVHGGTMRGLWRSTNSIYRGKRSTSAVYLEGKPNVTVLSRTHSKRILFADGAADTKRATGVEVVVAVDDKNENETETKTETHTFHAKYEVILSQGVFESPKLLMLSGIGPEKTLGDFGITPVAAPSEHVGQNLLDHPIMPHVFRLRDGTGLDSHILRPGPAHDGAVAAYAQRTAGPLTSGLLEVVGLPRIDDRLAQYPEYVAAKAANGGRDPFGPAGQPHFEIDFVPMFSDAFQWHFPCPPEGDYLTVIVDLLRPQSRGGAVTLQSTDPLVSPSVDLHFLDDSLDILALREGVRWVDDVLMTGEGMRDLLGADYPWPLPRHSDAAMDQQIKERMQTGFHPCGTLRLGKDVAQGVVDPELRVFGVERLRVVDASIIPVIPDCRIQNAVYMIGEKGADLIKATYPELYQ